MERRKILYKKWIPTRRDAVTMEVIPGTGKPEDEFTHKGYFLGTVLASSINDENALSGIWNIALVECEDGTIEQLDFYNIKFHEWQSNPKEDADTAK